jgi:hypothetical protein
MPHRDRRSRLRSREARQAARQQVPTASDLTSAVPVFVVCGMLWETISGGI